MGADKIYKKPFPLWVCTQESGGGPLSAGLRWKEGLDIEWKRVRKKVKLAGYLCICPSMYIISKTFRGEVAPSF